MELLVWLLIAVVVVLLAGLAWWSSGRSKNSMPPGQARGQEQGGHREAGWQTPPSAGAGGIDAGGGL
jgi:hypothetical protein